MDLYLIRHAEAEPETFKCHDIDRRLTDCGVTQARALGTALRSRGMLFTSILTSPAARTKETAQLLCEEMKLTPEQLVVSPELYVSKVSGKRLSFLLEQFEDESLAVVAHHSDLPAIVGWLIGGKRPDIFFPLAGCACIDVDEPESRIEKGSGTFLWLVTPEWC